MFVTLILRFGSSFPKKPPMDLRPLSQEAQSEIEISFAGDLRIRRYYTINPPVSPLGGVFIFDIFEQGLIPRGPYKIVCNMEHKKLIFKTHLLS